MSSVTATSRSPTRDISIQELRRLEAQTREIHRRRLSVANQRIADLEARYQSTTARLDEAARRLPDLLFDAPPLAAVSSEIAQDPVKLEAYADHLANQVQKFSRELDHAISEAERLLQLRIAKAAAWRRIGDLEQCLDLFVQRNREITTRTFDEYAPIALPVKPHFDAELHVVEAYESALKQFQRELESQYESLCARAASRENAIALSGSQVQTRSANEAQARHEAEEVARARAKLRKHRDAELLKARLRLDDLSGALKIQIDIAIQQASNRDFHASITRWIARERQQLDGIARALALLQASPDFVHADPQLSQRWASLSAQLQRIASGWEDINPSVEREYEQICADARRLLNIAFSRIAWVNAMTNQGFEIFEREDGQGLVVVDLDHPEIWLEATEYETEQGGFATTLELKTDDSASHTSEEKMIDDICTKLAQATDSTMSNVATKAEVIEHRRRITRGRRPTMALKKRL